MNTYTIKNNIIELKFDYKAEIVSAVKTIQGKRYYPETKTWTIPLSQFKFIQEMLNYYDFYPDTDNSVMPEETKDFTDFDLKELENKLKLDLAPHQKTALKSALQFQQYALLLEQRCGKTPVSIAYIICLCEQKKARKTLVLAEKTLLYQWNSEITKWSNLKPLVIEGNRDKKLELLNTDSDVYIMNYESLRIMTENYETKSKAKWIKPLPELQQFDIIIADESQNLKNYSDKTKVALALREYSKYRLILTGTPITKNAIDVYYQFDFLNPDFLGYYGIYHFREKHCILGKFKEIKGYKDLNILQEKIKKYSIRILRKDVIKDLPDKIYETRQVEMTGELIRQYNAMIEDLTLEFAENKVTATTALTEMLRLAQITAGHFLELNDKEQHNNPKTDEVLKIITETDDKVVIWIKYIHSLQAVGKKLQSDEIPFTWISGEIAPEERTRRIKEFNETNRFKAIIIQIQTGKVGIDLSDANTVIFYENDYNYGLRAQAEDRVQTIFKDKKDNALYIDLIATIPGVVTIDEYIMDMLKKKKEISDVLIDDMKAKILKIK